MLSAFIKRSQESNTSPSLSSVWKQALLHGASHVAALAELFQLELKEYGELLKRRYCFLILASSCFLLCYFAVWAMVVMSLWYSVGGFAALGVFTLFHSSLAIIFAILGLRTKPGSLAPMTREELKSDITCINLSIKENSRP